MLPDGQPRVNRHPNLPTGRQRNLPSARLSRSIFSWNVGARGYLRARKTLRPFGELTVGMRLVDSIESAEGTLISPRLGVSLGRTGSAGISLASGIDFNLCQPRLHDIVPVRLAIVFR